MSVAGQGHKPLSSKVDGVLWSDDCHRDRTMFVCQPPESRGRQGPLLDHLPRNGKCLDGSSQSESHAMISAVARWMTELEEMFRIA